LRAWRYSKKSLRIALDREAVVLGTRHTGLVVRDLERSLAFYRDLLGLEVWRRATEEGSYIENVVGISNVRLEWAKLKAPDGSVVELLQYHSHPDSAPVENSPSNRLGCSHVAFTVGDLDFTFSKLQLMGVHCNNEPQVSADGAAKVLYCHDPDGIILELVEECKK
jgi:catechol 2,3-dioxygenase-like lactoylglutathione lyase family enzyme